MAKAKTGPWFPPEAEFADITALQAVAAGIGNEQQQQRAMKWIIEKGCAAYDLSYRPDSERDTAFAEGRRFVGLQIVKHIKTNISAVRARNANAS